MKRSKSFASTFSLTDDEFDVGTPAAHYDSLPEDLFYHEEDTGERVLVGRKGEMLPIIITKFKTRPNWTFALKFRCENFTQIYYLLFILQISVSNELEITVMEKQNIKGSGNAGGATTTHGKEDSHSGESSCSSMQPLNHIMIIIRYSSRDVVFNCCFTCDSLGDQGDVFSWCSCR